MHDAQRLYDSDSNLVLGQSVESLQHGFDLTLSQQFLCELLCGTLSDGQNIHDKLIMCLLSRPCLICFVARASTESNSTNILTMMSVIIGVGGMFT